MSLKFIKGEIWRDGQGLSVARLDCRCSSVLLSDCPGSIINECAGCFLGLQQLSLLLLGNSGGLYSQLSETPGIVHQPDFVDVSIAAS